MLSLFVFVCGLGKQLVVCVFLLLRALTLQNGFEVVFIAQYQMHCSASERVKSCDWAVTKGGIPTRVKRA